MNPGAGWEAFRERVPRAWGAYGLALVYVLVVAVDRAGYAMLMGATLLLTVALGVAGLVALVQVGVRWARFKVYSFLPPALLLVAFPLGASFGSILLRERFFWNQAEYEYVANQIVAGTYPEKLLPEHKHLGFWVHPARIDEKPEGACFLVVTHGFAGHNGYCYAADPAKLRDVVAAGDWRLSRRLNDQWALVRD